ncbi:preprotein translocase subunit SecY [Candidatus Bathyarchaeota archaeon]|nr:preprotein translocase subunit SecY [Candidatus Bathyarchaeota archaeon]
MPGRFLTFFKPIATFMPEVSKSDRRVNLGEKLLWTALVLVVYLLMSEIPLFGITSGQGVDPFQYLRVIFASNRGTLMELGIGPIVTAGLILQLLAGSGIISVDFGNSEDRTLFTSVTKFFTIIMTVFTATVYIIGGAYGPITIEAAAIIFLQLIAVGLILMLLDELVQKGWGIGSGISLFIIAGVAQKIWWSCLAPLGPMPDGKFLGAFLAFIQSLLNGAGLWAALYRSENLPDMIGFIATVIVFIIVIYLEGIRVEIPIAHARFRGYRAKYPVKLLYVSNIPVILSSALFANIYLFSQIIWSNFNQNNQNFLLNLIGTYNATSREPIGGLVYYVIPPRNFNTLITDPVRALIYVGLMAVMGIMFARMWLEVGGLDSGSVAKQLMDSGMHVPGFRRAYKPLQQLLNRYIPTLALLGGLIVSIVASLADFFGVFGTGMGALLAVGILYQLYQQLAQEQMVEMYPILGRVMG